MIKNRLLWIFAISVCAGFSFMSCSDDDNNDNPGDNNQDGVTTTAKKYGINFTVVNSETAAYKNSVFVTENLVGDGEYFTVSGFEADGNDIYTALCPMGYSAYGIETNATDQDYSDLITSNRYTGEQTIASTCHPNKVWIGIYEGINNFGKAPTIISDDRISYATSRYRSQFFPTICPDGNGHIYVFSNSLSKANTDARTRTTLDAGVVRVNTSSKQFDPDYYCNIEDAAQAALGSRLSFFQVWHITGSKFLMRMYATEGSYDSMSDAKVLTVFDADTKTMTKVAGFPEADEFADMGRFIYTENGKAYIPVVFQSSSSGSHGGGNGGGRSVTKAATQQPAIYIIDAATATATKGATVKADGGITAISKMIDENGGEGYVIAAASSEASYLISATAAEINDPNVELSIIAGSGKVAEADAATHWLFPNYRYAYGLKYQQGDDGVSASFELKSDGSIAKRPMETPMPNYTAFGTNGQYLILGAADATSL